MSLAPERQRSRGQVIVIFAVTLLALLFFAGLAIDSGALYITYGQLRRSIDAAAIASANEYKKETSTTAAPIKKMKAAAEELLKMNGLDPSTLNVYVCDADGNGVRDTDASVDTDGDGTGDTPGAINNAEFYAQCPDPSSPDSKLGRKLVWLDATVNAPLYFLQLLGFHIVPMTSSSIAEAASIDLVIVLDTSQSMANDTTIPINGDPTTCNHDNNCQPMLDAKNAAKSLIDTLYPGYDQVAVIGFDVLPKNYSIHTESGKTYEMRTNLAEAKNDVTNLQVHHDPDYRLPFYDWRFNTSPLYVNGYKTLGFHFNPVYPEDRDGDGYDADPHADPVKCDETAGGYENRWQSGKPCDDPDKLDAFNGDNHGTDWGNTWDTNIYTTADTDFSKALVAAGTPCDPDNYETCSPPAWTKLTVNSTCTGCGIRLATEVLKRNGRPKSVWVMVFLSDGVANLSDTSDTVPASEINRLGLGNPGNPSSLLKNGFCNGGIDSFMWANGCLDTRKALQSITLNLNAAGKIKEGAETTASTLTYQDFGNTRYCIDSDPLTCPPGSVYVTGANAVKYSVFDYALDRADDAGLGVSRNRHEIPEGEGSDITIFSIGLGDLKPNVSGSNPIGEYLLRYLANVGYDNDRTTDECAGKAYGVSCGQYYYAPDGAGLRTIFNDISKKIFTRLTK
jgi:Flp pilus assembly protein TadG